MHGNTALALVIGAARRHELTGEEPFLRIASHFFQLVDGSRSYATGGSTHNGCGARQGSSATRCCTMPSAGFCAWDEPGGFRTSSTR